MKLTVFLLYEKDIPEKEIERLLIDAPLPFCEIKFLSTGNIAEVSYTLGEFSCSAISGLFYYLSELKKKDIFCHVCNMK